MKILVGKFVLEANEHIPVPCELTDFNIKFGDDCINNMMLGDTFNRSDIQLIPTIYADAASKGVMSLKAFRYIEDSILERVIKHKKEIDGIFLHLHGASEVEEIGSGDHHILAKIREIVGPYLPIGIVCDPHGNLCKSYVENATIIRSYRESPHIDIPSTIQFVGEKLIEQIKHPANIQPVYRKLPLILGGEQSVSTDEPVKSINHILDKYEEDPRILSCSWHVGYIRHDTPVAGAGIVVIPSSSKYIDYANHVADQIAEFVISKRHEFHYTGVTMQEDQAIDVAIKHQGKPVFITDSGDNVTSGAMGANTILLRKFLRNENLDKKVLFASIHDKKAYSKLKDYKVHDVVELELGMQLDQLSSPVHLKAEILNKGEQIGTKLFGEVGNYGGGVLIRVIGTSVDIIVAETNHCFVEPEQTLAIGASWNDYDIIIVKIGYAFPEINKLSSLAIMALTDGATIQDTKKIKFKLIQRPMFPIDEI